ncbi:MAG: hypothetical protein H0V23_08980 [Nocardioidaceae bacterium]|nr:hypothetical protein [Nocardioidaceae bacterium]
MFDEFRDLPLHPLVVHATVVVLPLIALMGVLFVMPRLRAPLRWPLLAGALVSLALLVVTRQSGEALKESLNLGGASADAVERHQELADQLVWILVAFAVLVVIAVIATRPTKAPPPQSTETTSSQRREAVAQTALAVLVLITAAAVGVQTARVGEAGSKAVWNPTGDTSFDTND